MLNASCVCSKTRQTLHNLVRFEITRVSEEVATSIFREESGSSRLPEEMAITYHTLLCHKKRTEVQ
jgi:hypothetical protein